MDTQIDTKYDRKIDSFVVRMPGFISLNALKTWKKEFLATLSQINDHDKKGVLIDTNNHQFESVECLKYLRELFSEPQIKRSISRFAFVSPGRYRKPEIIDYSEGYFLSFEEAYRWLS